MNNSILLLDLLAGSLTVMAKIQALLQKAATEGRDVTDTELAELKTANDQLEQDIINS